MQTPATTTPLRVVIYDAQWALVELVRDFLSIEPGIEVVAAAHELEKLPTRWEDVDVLFFGLAGKSAPDDEVQWLTSRLAETPLPTLLAAPHTIPGGEAVMRSLQAGALDFVLKTAFRQSHQLSEFGFDVARRVKSLARATVSPDVAPPAPFRRVSRSGPARSLVGVTTSPSGLKELKRLLGTLPIADSGILVSVPFPSLYTMSLASHLERACGFEVREAVDHDRIDTGRVLIAPGNFHLQIFPGNQCYYARLNQRPPSPRPSADSLFESMAAHAGHASVGIVLSGAEGAVGLAALKRAGAMVISQKEENLDIDGILERILARYSTALAS